MAKTLSSQRGLYKRGDVYYSRIAGPGGKLIRKRLSTDKQTAIIMLGEMRKTAELQKVGIIPEKTEEQVTDFKTLKRLYFDRLKTHNRRERTIESYLRAWKYVIEDNNLTRITDISVTKIEQFAERLRAKGTRTQTINIYINVVKGALAWARDFEYITRNPLARWETLKKDASIKRRDFTPEEIDRFLAAEEDNLYRLLWLLYFRTGLRASAGLNFEWEWISWDERAAVLPEDHNKSRSDFWLPLDDDLFAAFEARRALVGPDMAHGRVFPGAEIKRIQKRFRRNCDRAGLDRTGLCLHSIRHTYATMCFATMCFESSGNNVKVVQELLCHAEGSTTMRYIHASSQQKRETVERNALRLRLPGAQAALEA